MFTTVYTYKIALLPFPAVFITAFSEVPAIFIQEALNKTITDLTMLIDIAQKDYKALVITNEPTGHTHNLNFNSVKNAVAVYCSLKFQNTTDMNNFLANEIKNKQ